jgi:ribosomal protein S18 acetylase RimI-like enzyme
MSEYHIRIANTSEQNVVMNTLMLAFSADPCIRYVFPKAETYVAGYRSLAAAIGGAAFANGTAYLADDGGAAALWLPPGVESDGEAIGRVIQELVAEGRQNVLGEVVAGMEQHHPKIPHWYLAMIGADPSRQGQGLGSALLKEGLKRCDADGVIAYLESSNPKNIPLYERYGFEVIGVIQPGDFPPFYPMQRPART